MSRFVDINGATVNIDTISRVFATNGGTRVVYKSGEWEDSRYISDIAQIEGRDLIKQVIPVKVPTVAVYKDDNGQLFETEVFYLGLTENGEVRALELTDDRTYEFSDAANNFIRLKEGKIGREELQQ